MNYIFQIKLFIFSFTILFILGELVSINGEELVHINDDVTNAEKSWYSWLWNNNKNMESTTLDQKSLTEETTLQAEMSEKSYLSWIEDMLGSNNEQPASSLDILSPNALLKYLVSENEADDTLSLLLDVYNVTDGSYLTTMSTFMKLFLYFMPDSGMMSQAQYFFAIMKIIGKVGFMYLQNYSDLEIAVTILPEMMYAATLTRRDVNEASELLLKPGDVVDIHSMNAETFIEYTELIDFPSLSDVQEEEIRNDVEQLVQEYYPDTSEEKQESIIHTLINAVKFFALFKPIGELL